MTSRLSPFIHLSHVTHAEESTPHISASTFLCECVYEIKQLLIAVFCLRPFPDLHPDASRRVPTDRPPDRTSADGESPSFQAPFPNAPGERLFPFISTHGCGMTLVQRRCFVWGLVCGTRASSPFHPCSKGTPRAWSSKYPDEVMMLQVSDGVTGGWHSSESDVKQDSKKTRI